MLDYSIKDTTFLYQILDLPIISDRHYITKNYTDTITSNHYRLNWMINSKQNLSLFNDFIEFKKDEHKDPIFIVDGVGSWEIKALNYEQTLVSYYVLIDPGGWIPDYLVTYANKALGPDTVLLMLGEGKKRGIDRVITSSYLVCLREEVAPLLYQMIDQENLLIMNNNDFPMNQAGSKNVRKVILLGTPNLGSVGSVKSFITGLKVGLRKVPTEVLVTMPSVYQLFPHSINDWVIDTSGKPLDHDVFDTETWRQFQW